MAQTFRRAMDALYILCVVIAGAGIAVMTAVIPYGVWCRYVLEEARAWPEPLSVLMMVLFVFFGMAVVYRGGGHISVTLFTDAMPPAARRVVLLAVDVLMAGICLFMVIWGTSLVQYTWMQVIAEFPFLSVGITYLPIPVGGAITLCFIVERVLIGPPGAGSIVHAEPVEE